MSSAWLNCSRRFKKNKFWNNSLLLNVYSCQMLVGRGAEFKLDNKWQHQLLGTKRHCVTKIWNIWVIVWLGLFMKCLKKKKVAIIILIEFQLADKSVFLSLSFLCSTLRCFSSVQRFKLDGHVNKWTQRAQERSMWMHTKAPRGIHTC